MKPAHSHLTSNAKTCATRVVPTSAPSMIASAIGSVSRPRPVNEASSSAVAVALCSTPATPMPVPNATARLREA